jgi:hypothetical protein
MRRRNVSVYLHGRCGLGDNIYWRPLVRQAAREYRIAFVETPWPELFRDLPVRCVPPRKTKLRTQLKNVASARARRLYARAAPLSRRKVRLKYDWNELPASNVFAVMESHLGLRAEPFAFDLPDFGQSPVKTDKPIAFLRPVTERTEWLNKARNPLPEYVAQATEILRAEGFHVVLVADLEDGKEWLVGPQPVADQAFLKGELSAVQMLALIQHSAIVVGPVGFIVPAALAAQVPLIAIGGGQGGHNAPERIVDPRMDASRATFILPDPYCSCVDMLHDCPKVIPDFAGRFTAALEALCSQNA